MRSATASSSISAGFAGNAAIACAGGRTCAARSARPRWTPKAVTPSSSACPANMGIKIPDGVDWTAAALACCPIGTSLRALRRSPAINPGDTVLITGASGGLGVHQIQIARALGGRPIAVTTSPAKIDFLAIARRRGRGRRQRSRLFGRGLAADRQTRRRYRRSTMSVRPCPRRCAAWRRAASSVVLGNVGGDAGAGVARLADRPALARRAAPEWRTLEDVAQSLAMLQAGMVKAGDLGDGEIFGGGEGPRHARGPRRRRDAW